MASAPPTPPAGEPAPPQLKGREVVNHVAGKPVSDELIAWTAELIATLRSADEGREGLSAFLEKRAPAWRAN